MKIIAFVLRILIFVFCADAVTAQNHRIMFYNTENFFDIQNNPRTRDDEFTPSGARHWTKVRYATKLKNIAKVITRLGKGNFPLIIGLAEVENENVIRDLIRKTLLREGNYAYIHHESPDLRGIDVALLFSEKEVCLSAKKFITLNLAKKNIRSFSREILYAKLRFVKSHHDLHIFVCHFPSKRGGVRATEWKREIAARTLRRQIDSIQKADSREARILVMGDMNCRANEKVIREVLNVRTMESMPDPAVLYNTGSRFERKNVGTYKFRGKWELLDHIFVTGNLLCDDAEVRVGVMQIFSEDFMIEKDKKHYGFRPRPTYSGMRYRGGCSDHFPVYVDVYLK